MPAHSADSGARVSRRRPGCRKLDADPGLRERVTGDLRKAWSPQQIPGRLCRERKGAEMAQHAALTLATDIPVYFAHAHSP